MTFAIMSDKAPANLESFIQAHWKHIAPDTHYLYQSGRNFFNQNNDIITPFIHRSVHNILAHAWKTPDKANRALSQILPRSFAEKQVTKHLKHHKVQAILVEYGHFAAWNMRLLKNTGLPFIVHFHGYDAYRHDILQKYTKHYKELFHHATAIIAVSEDMRGQLIKLGAPPEKISTIPCGIDIQQFQGASPQDAPPHFLFTGRFTRKKAPYLTLLAFSKAHDRMPEIRLTMIGDGQLLEICRRMAHAMNLQDAVEFTGKLPHQQIASHMQKSRCYVQHSVTASDGDSEGTPVAISEGSASGLPVIATRHAGIKESIIEGQTGFLVEENDIDTMAENMLEIARDPELAARLGAAGRQRIKQHYSLKKTTDALRQILTDAGK